MSPRAELRLAVLLALAGAALLLLSTTEPWVTGSDPLPPPLPDRAVALEAADLDRPVRALGLVGLAGVVAVAATRRTGRVVVGVLLVVAGLAAGWSAADVLLDARGATALPEAQLGATGWPAVAVAGGVVTALAGGLVAARGRRWAQLSGRYEAPAARRGAAATSGRAAPGVPAAPASEAAIWDALDRGEDPTARG